MKPIYDRKINHDDRFTCAISGRAPGREKSTCFERRQAAPRYEQDVEVGVIRSSEYYRNRRWPHGKAQREFNAKLNHFRPHAHKTQYAGRPAAGLPLGSGVTEAGRKGLIKAPFCHSAMRWNGDSWAKSLQLRAVRLSDQWDSFWNEVMRYAA